MQRSPRISKGQVESAWLLSLGLGAAALAGVLAVNTGAEPAPVAARTHAAEPAGAVRYSRDIRRLLSDRCFQCHGPDAGTREADLRLDVRDSAVAARPDGTAAIVPGNPEASELWRRITTHDADEAMPPAAANKRPLSDREKQLFHDWIAQGAEYEPHWAFAPPVRHAAPGVKNSAWPRGDIDRFVLASLEAAGTAPSPEADRATLLRRVFLDLTGLPPTPEELAEFAGDTSPDAYERWVDRLLTQEPYRSRLAERLAVPWLDASRYADTCGIHTDNGRQLWPWRDWVLRALRDNMPYDRFLTEQLAGDLLPEPTVDQVVATGFNRNHVTTDEGGAIAEEYLVEYAVDRASTTASVFLGLTLNCARCHDHKFDPITQEDFYSFYSFFNSIEEPGLYSQTQDANRAYEPFIAVPAPEQQARIAEVNARIAEAAREMARTAPDEAQQREAHMRQLLADWSVAWASSTVESAHASNPSTTLAVQPDQSVLATGAPPATEDYTITLRIGDGAPASLRSLLIEAVAPDGDVSKPAGRNANGNAVLTGASLSILAPGAGDDQWRSVPLTWAWADHEQLDGNHAAANVLDTSDREGWAIGAHQKPGKRLLLLLSEQEFAAPPGSRARVTLSFQSIYPGHSLARVRLSLGALGEPALASLPASSGRWHVAGPFHAARSDLFGAAFGPESGAVSAARAFAENQSWKFDLKLIDNAPVALGDGTNVFYVGRRIYSPSPRTLSVSLGSDDGFRLFVNGAEAGARNTERGVMPDQDAATITLKPGANDIVLKIVNTGGASGYYYATRPRVEDLPHELIAGLLPPAALSEQHAQLAASAWRRAFLPAYREAEAQQQALIAQKAELEKSLPQTMVMKELAEPRPSYVLTRGQYDKPDLTRPVQRAVPAFLGKLPPGAPSNRLGLAHWLTSDDNPLTARVAVNRIWEVLFGVGLVRTSEDFGLQGEWPTHPELLDTLAVEFREGGWNVHALIRSMVTSATYRQSSRVRDDLAETDPDNRLLSYYPRRRLSAEQIRDLALFASGLLVEQLGGESVKPYQPDGLWQEVAMLASNTKRFERGEGPDLWRRSLYTYWKRACPPPSLQTLDAPTREACVIRRATTNTPLQALVTWNDEQFVESARALAHRVLSTPGDDDSRLALLFTRCTARAPDAAELALLRGALADFRARFHDNPPDAALLVTVGASPPPLDVPWSELAPWTLLANSVLNLHETITQD